MNSIGKIISAQGLSFISSIQDRLSPEQQLECENRKEQRRQERNRKYLTTSKKRYDATAADKTIYGVLKEGEEFIHRHLTASDIAIYNYLLATTHLKYESAISQQRIADEVGVNPCTVSRCLNKLESLSLIKRKTYGILLKPGRDYIYRQQCTYELPNFMFRKDIAFKLHKLFTSLSYKARSLYKFIALSLLFANTSSNYPKISSLSEYARVDNRYIYKQRISTSKCTGFEDKTSQSPPIANWNFMKHSPVSDVLRCEVTPLLGLTRKGQIYLSAYHDEALASALKVLKSLGKNDRDFDFRLFVNACNNYIAANKHESTIDLQRVAQLYKQYGCREDAPYYYPTPTSLGELRRPSPPKEYNPDKFSEPKSSQPVVPVAPAKKEITPPQQNEPDFTHPVYGNIFQQLAQRMGLKFNSDRDK